MVMGNLFTIKIYQPRKLAKKPLLRKVLISSTEAVLQEVSEQDIQKLITEINQKNGQYVLYRWKFKKAQDYSLAIYLEDDAELALAHFKPQIYEFFYNLFYTYSQKNTEEQLAATQKLTHVNETLQAEKEQLKVDKELLDGENRQLIFDKTILDTELDALNRQKLRLEQENLQLQKQKEAYSPAATPFSNDEKDALEKQIQQLELKATEASEKQQVATQEAEQLKLENQTLTKELVFLKQEKQQLSTEQENLLGRKENLQAENRQMKVQINQIEHQHQQLTEDKRLLNIQVHNLTAEVEKLKGTITQLELKLREKPADRQPLRTATVKPNESVQPVNTDSNPSTRTDSTNRLNWDPQEMAEVDTTKIECTHEITLLKNKFELANNTNDRSKKRIRARLLKDGISKIGYCKYFWNVIDLKKCTTLDQRTFELLNSWVTAAPALIEDIEENAGKIDLDGNGYAKISKRNLAFMEGYRSFYHFLSGFYKL